MGLRAGSAGALAASTLRASWARCSQVDRQAAIAAWGDGRAASGGRCVAMARCGAAWPRFAPTGRFDWERAGEGAQMPRVDHKGRQNPSRRREAQPRPPGLAYAPQVGGAALRTAHAPAAAVNRPRTADCRLSRSCGQQASRAPAAGNLAQHSPPSAPSRPPSSPIRSAAADRSDGATEEEAEEADDPVQGGGRRAAQGRAPRACLRRSLCSRRGYLCSRPHACAPSPQVAELEDFLFGNAAAVFDAGNDDDGSEGLNIRDLVKQARPWPSGPLASPAAPSLLTARWRTAGRRPGRHRRR